MCHHCDDLQRTTTLLDDLAAYADLPGADLEFADAIGYSLSSSLLLAVTPHYPPTGHTFPRQEQ